MNRLFLDGKIFLKPKIQVAFMLIKKNRCTGHGQKQKQDPFHYRPF